MMAQQRLNLLFFSVMALCLIGLSSCLPVSNTPKPGPDKQSSGTWTGAMLGAGAGAVTGAQLSAGTGPGALVGAGLGALYGMVNGLGQDLLEEDQLRRAGEEKQTRELLWVQDVLAKHYERRMELHPSRDIFPADLFFKNDSTKLKMEAGLLVAELARLTQRRVPWSRILIVVYATSTDFESSFASYVTSKRAHELATEFVRAGIEPRRIQVQGLTLAEPVLIDPDDWPGRYRQAIEIIAMDY